MKGAALRTGKIGLADFLYKRRVPSVTSPAAHVAGTDKLQNM